jgi:hypothetical protein
MAREYEMAIIVEIVRNRDLEIKFGELSQVENII